MDERPIELPESAWERVSRDPWKLAAVVLSALAVLALLGSGVAMLLQRPTPMPSVAREGGAPRPNAPSAPTTATGEPTSVAPTSRPRPSLQPTRTPPSGPRKTTPSSPSTETRVAFRRDGRVLVARADGETVAGFDGHVADLYALSPDGRTIAFVTGLASSSSNAVSLRLVDVATGELLGVVRRDLAGVPVWAPDSSWLAFTVAGQRGWEVWRASRDGRGARKLAEGHATAISYDGRRVAIADNAAEDQNSVSVLDLATRRRVRVERTANVVSWHPDGRLLLLHDGKLGWLAPGTDRRGAVLTLPAPVVAASYSALLISPDGSRIAIAETGDDGYSRLVVATLASGNVTRVKTRRDVYPLRWSADGSRILCFEGNAIQGESSRIVCLRAEGGGRTVVVEAVAP